MMDGGSADHERDGRARHSGGGGAIQHGAGRYVIRPARPRPIRPRKWRSGPAASESGPFGPLSCPWWGSVAWPVVRLPGLRAPTAPPPSALPAGSYPGSRPTAYARRPAETFRRCGTARPKGVKEPNRPRRDLSSRSAAAGLPAEGMQNPSGNRNLWPRPVRRCPATSRNRGHFPNAARCFSGSRKPHPTVEALRSLSDSRSCRSPIST
jgi:hypothetical protein